jgi:hypothetical protein
METQMQIDLEFLKDLLTKTTQGPWQWSIEDYSMATLMGPGYEWDHVMSVSPCNACMERAKNANENWKWGRCTCPTGPNATLLSMAPAIASALIEKSKYPMKVAEHIWQYDDTLFVWEDETGQWAGVGHTLKEVQNQMKRYAQNM